MRFVALLFCAAVSLSAQQCTYTLKANAFVAGAAASSTNPPASFTVATSSQGCTFTASTGAAWIHITNGPGYTGTSDVMFTIDSNQNSSQLRKDVITVATPTGQSLSVTVTQVAGICNYSLSATSNHFPLGGGSGSFNVTTGCAWTAASNQGWVSLGSSTSFLGNGTVNYTAAANVCVAARTATVTVQAATSNPPTFQIMQDGSDANLSFSPASVGVAVGASMGRVTVNTGAACPWTAYSDSGWLQIVTAANGSGSGGITYSIAANTGPTRTGNLHIGNDLFPVTQQGVSAPAPQLTTILNGASYSGGAVSPGEIVALFGSTLGPAQGVPYQLGAGGTSIGNSLGGVQVLFNGTAAPLLYVSAGQINAIVPYEVAGSSNASIQVTYQATPSNTLTVPVQGATPGLFSIDRSGSGPGAILNQDYSVNSGTVPAPRGTPIMIYCTGTGVTDPAGSDGVLTPLALPYRLIPASVNVQVTIGGIPATVVYAGAAPGAVAGLTQINAVVPGGVSPGENVPVSVQIGNTPSQAGITVAVQ